MIGFLFKKKSLTRTVILAVAACATLVWVAIDSFGIPAKQILDYLIALLIGAAGIIVFAAIALGVIMLLKRLFR